MRNFITFGEYNLGVNETHERDILDEELKFVVKDP
jgi:hypothetical protein